MSRTALVVVDMLHPYGFEDADRVAENAPAPVERIAELLARADEGDALVAYVNDNYGAWNASRDELVETALAGNHPELVEPIKPKHEHAFVWKARHSAFFQTPVDYLLRSEDCDRIVLTGQVTEQCVLYTALDAYIRHYELVVPEDASVPLYPDLAEAAMQMMGRNMRAETPSATEVRL